jgi:hypothetical protein
MTKEQQNTLKNITKEHNIQEMQYKKECMNIEQTTCEYRTNHMNLSVCLLDVCIKVKNMTKEQQNTLKNITKEHNIQEMQYKKEQTT